MFSPKLLWFLSLICSLSASVYASYGPRYGADYGVNATCAGNIQITNLTYEEYPSGVGHDPFYYPESGSVLYMSEEYPAGVNRYEIDTKKHYYADLEILGCKKASSIIPIKNTRNSYFITCNDKLSILYWDGKSKNVNILNVTRPDSEHEYVKSAKVYPNGVLMFHGDPDYSSGVNRSTLLALINGKPKKLIVGIYYGTGIGYNADGTCLYFSDFTRRYVYKASYNPKINRVDDVEVLVDFAKINLGEYNADSLTVDAQGYVWVTVYMGGLIIKVDPYTKQVVCSIKCPAQRVTNLTWGRCPNSKSGKLNCLWVTALYESRQTTDARVSFFLIEGIESSYGVLNYELELSTLFPIKKKPYSRSSH